MTSSDWLFYWLYLQQLSFLPFQKRFLTFTSAYFCRLVKYQQNTYGANGPQFPCQSHFVYKSSEDLKQCLECCVLPSHIAPAPTAKEKAAACWMHCCTPPTVSDKHSSQYILTYVNECQSRCSRAWANAEHREHVTINQLGAHTVWSIGQNTNKQAWH